MAQKLDEYESQSTLADKEGQGGLYEFKFITQLEVNIPNHKAAFAALGKIQDDPENETLESSKFRRPHSALGDETKPIEWKKYSLNVNERMNKITEIQESDNKMELLTSFLKVDTDKIIDEANINKSAWLLKGGQLIVEPVVFASEEGGETASKNKTDSQTSNENPQDVDKTVDMEEAEEQKVGEDPLQHYLNKRHDDQK